MAETFWALELSKPEFVRLLRGDDVGKADRVRGTPAAPMQGKVVSVWQGEWRRNNPPAVVLIEEDDEREFFAWAWTYLGEFRPLTAYSHVLCGRQMRMINARRESDWPHEFAMPFTG